MSKFTRRKFMGLFFGSAAAVGLGVASAGPDLWPEIDFAEQWRESTVDIETKAGGGGYGHEHGIDYVPAGQLALLHYSEVVVSPCVAEEYRAEMRTGMTTNQTYNYQGTVNAKHARAFA